MLDLFEYLYGKKAEKSEKGSVPAVCILDRIPPDWENGIWSPHSFLLYMHEGAIRASNQPDLLTAEKEQAVFCKKGGHFPGSPAAGNLAAYVFFLPDELINTESVGNSGNGLSADLTEYSHTGHTSLENDELLGTFFQSVVSYTEPEKCFSDRLAGIKCRELLYLLTCRLQDPGIIRYFRTLASAPGIKYRTILERNYNYNLRRGEYAAICGLGEDELERWFQTAYGAELTQWLIEKRLEHARIQLLGTEAEIEVISRQSGFKTAAHFTRSFKRKFGLPPDRFRETHVFG